MIHLIANLHKSLHERELFKDISLSLFSRFVCQFNIEGRVTSVNAQLLGDVIYCDEMEFAYTSR